jgi:hypothetical protein
MAGDDVVSAIRNGNPGVSMNLNDAIHKDLQISSHS